MYSLLVYRNAVDFCVLLSYPAILLNSFISSRFVFSLEFSFFPWNFLYRQLFHLQIGPVLFLSYSSICLLFLCSCLSAVVRTCGMILNKNPESRHQFLIPNLWGEWWDNKRQGEDKRANWHSIEHLPLSRWVCDICVIFQALRTTQEQRKEKANGQMIKITVVQDIKLYQFVTVVIIYQKSTILRIVGPPGTYRFHFLESRSPSIE